MIRALVLLAFLLFCPQAFPACIQAPPGSGVIQDDSQCRLIPNLGVPGSQAGGVTIANGTSGGANVTIQNPSATAAYNYNLPATAGAAGQIRTSGGGGTSPDTWTAVTGSGSVVEATSPTIATPSIANPTITGSFTASGLVTNASLATMASGTLKCNPTGSTGAPQDCWNSVSNNVQGTTSLIGLDGTQFFQFYSPTNAAPAQPNTLWIKTVPNYSGGTNGFVQAGLRSQIVNPSGVKNFEWALVGEVDNSSTAADGGNSVGVYGQGNAVTSTAGPTWGGTMQVQDQSAAANPTAGRVGLEVDNSANGTDTNNTRVILDAVVQNFNSGTAPTVTYGLRVSPQANTVTNGLFFNSGTFTNFINSNSGTFVVDGSGNITGASLKSSGSFSAKSPNTQTGSTYVVAATDYSIIANNSGGTMTLTLPSASTFSGRVLLIKTTQNQTVVSASSNVAQLVGGLSTAILAATSGKWALLQSDGSNWVIMASN